MDTLTRPLLISAALLFPALLLSVRPAAAADPSGKPSDGPAAIDPAQFDHVLALIKPPAAEQQWESIPWGTSLWDARKKAAAEGKPIVLWEMDGHPLGCV